MAMIKIRKSVGKKGQNKVDDVKKVQELLNLHTKAGGYKKLVVDMDVGDKTIGAIKGFQKKALGMKSPDGRVDPGGMTLNALNEKPGAVTPGGGKGGENNGGGSSSKGASGGGSKSKGKSGGSGGGESAAELEQRRTSAQNAVDRTTSEILKYQGHVEYLDYIEQRYVTAANRLKQGFKLMRRARDEENERLKAEQMERIEKAVDEASRCTEEVKKKSSPLSEVKCDKKVDRELAELVKIVKKDHASHANDVVDKLEKSAPIFFGLVFGMVKTMRLASTAYILAQKAKRALHQKVVDDTTRELRKAKKHAMA